MSNRQTVVYKQDTALANIVSNIVSKLLVIGEQTLRSYPIE